MTEPPNRDVSRDDLHAYADGQLSPERRREVEDHLTGDPAAAAMVAAWQAQNDGIRALFAGDLRADAMADRAEMRALAARFSRTRRRWLAAAAAAALFAAGGISGSVLTRALGGGSVSAPSLSEASRDSYVVYAGEVRHPVEVGADQEAHLVAWLGKRLGAPLAAPDLGPLGFRLVGGRLVPIGDAPGAMLMYQDTRGERLTCLIARSTDRAGGTGFRYSELEGVSTFYWIDGDFGYALSAPFARERLLAIANAVYGQI